MGKWGGNVVFLRGVWLHLSVSMEITLRCCNTGAQSTMTEGNTPPLSVGLSVHSSLPSVLHRDTEYIYLGTGSFFTLSLSRRCLLSHVLSNTNIGMGPEVRLGPRRVIIAV